MSDEEKKPEIKESEAEEPAIAAPNSCDHLCFHEGDRICYNDWGDKELLKRVYQDEEVISTGSNSSESQDTIHSGESLFKTFTFDAPDNDPDMKKCMAFWKSILAKNVKPAKCSLLKIKKEKVIKAKKEDTKPPDPCDNEENQKMWMDMYKDLQRRQLDKIKLGVQKKTCDPCEEYVDEEMEKKQQVEDIKKLNKWKPKHTQSTSKLNFEAQIQRTLSELRTKRSNKTQSKNLGKVPSSSENQPKSEGSASSNLNTIYNSLEDNKKFPSKSSIKFPPTEQVKSKEKEFKTTSSEMKQHFPTDQVKSKEKEVKTASPEINQLQVSPEIKSIPSKDSSQTEPSTSTRKKSRSSSTGFTLSPLHEPIAKEIKSNIMQLEETQIRTSITYEPIAEYGESQVNPCLCDECKCEETEQKPEKICHSCDCGEICICDSCDNITNVQGTTCTCGCSIDECICEEQGSKIHKIDTSCPCECGLDDCICRELSRICTCGDETCSCDIVDIISNYMESLVIEKGDTDTEIDVKLTREGLRFASASAQTDGSQFLPKWTLQETQQEGSYCIICGHFNCFCKHQTPCSTKK